MSILLVDDHQLIRDGLRLVLERAGLEVVGDAATGREALELAKRLGPDVVVMDVSMPDLNGIDATRLLLREFPALKVIALSMHSDRRYVDAMLAAGASGYLLKDSASEELIIAVRAIRAGGTYLSPAVAASIPGQTLSGQVTGKPLSPREREVLQLIAEGRSSKEIAQALELAVPTVETHRRQIAEKLNLRTVAELTKYAVREGLTSIE